MVFLRAYDAVARELEGLKSINEVRSLTLQDHITGTEDEFIVQPLIDMRKLAQSQPPERRKRVLDDRFSRGALVARDGSAVAMVAIPARTGNSLERLALESRILQVVDSHQLRGISDRRGRRDPGRRGGVAARCCATT